MVPAQVEHATKLPRNTYQSPEHNGANIGEYASLALPRTFHLQRAPETGANKCYRLAPDRSAKTESTLARSASFADGSTVDHPEIRIASSVPEMATRCAALHSTREAHDGLFFRGFRSGSRAQFRTRKPRRRIAEAGGYASVFFGQKLRRNGSMGDGKPVLAIDPAGTGRQHNRPSAIRAAAGRLSTGSRPTMSAAGVRARK